MAIMRHVCILRVQQVRDNKTKQYNICCCQSWDYGKNSFCWSKFICSGSYIPSTDLSWYKWIIEDSGSDFQLNNANTGGHPEKLYKPFSHCRARTSFFSIRVVNVWNDVPADIVDFRSLQSFKKTSSTVDLSKYLSAT